MEEEFRLIGMKGNKNTTTSFCIPSYTAARSIQTMFTIILSALTVSARWHVSVHRLGLTLSQEEMEKFTQYRLKRANLLQSFPFRNIKTQAIVNPGLKINFKDERDGFEVSYFYENGIKDYVQEFAEDTITEPVVFSGEGVGRDRPLGSARWNGDETGSTHEDDYTVKAEVAFCFSNKVQLLKYFHNSSPLEYGGSPEKAVKSALVSAFDKEIKTRGRYTAKEAKITFGDIQDSLILITNTSSTKTSYENQTKKAINNKFIQEFLTELIRNQMQIWFIENKPEADKVIDQILINKRSREQSENQRITVKKK